MVHFNKTVGQIYKNDFYYQFSASFLFILFLLLIFLSGKATPDQGGPRKTPDGVDPNIKRTRKTQRDSHNSGVKIWSLCSISSTLSHANLEQPFPAFLSCVVYSCVCHWYCVVVTLNNDVDGYIKHSRPEW